MLVFVLSSLEAGILSLPPTLVLLLFGLWQDFTTWVVEVILKCVCACACVFSAFVCICTILLHLLAGVNCKYVYMYSYLYMY